MIQLTCGNVLLKPSTRRQLMGCLRRAQKLGERIGGFFLNLCMKRSGKQFNLRADVRDAAGTFQLHARGTDWQTAVRRMVRELVLRLHSQLLARPAFA
jgi:hypothetical protein